MLHCLGQLHPLAIQALDLIFSRFLALLPLSFGSVLMLKEAPEVRQDWLWKAAHDFQSGSQSNAERQVHISSSGLPGIIPRWSGQTGAPHHDLPTGLAACPFVLLSKACMDHDRAEGEGVAPQADLAIKQFEWLHPLRCKEYTAIKIELLEWTPAMQKTFKKGSKVGSSYSRFFCHLSSGMDFPNLDASSQRCACWWRPEFFYCNALIRVQFGVSRPQRCVPKRCLDSQLLRAFGRWKIADVLLTCLGRSYVTMWQLFNSFTAQDELLDSPLWAVWLFWSTWQPDLRCFLNFLKETSLEIWETISSNLRCLRTELPATWAFRSPGPILDRFGTFGFLRSAGLTLLHAMIWLF